MKNDKYPFKERVDDWFYSLLPHRVYRLPFAIHDFWHYNIRMFLQKIFRRNHTSDIEIWNLADFMARYIYRKLKAFKDYPRVGYSPRYESPEEWEKDLDKMIFAFRFMVIKDLSIKNKERKKFFKDLGILDFEAEVEENKVLLKDFPFFNEPLYHNAEVEKELYDKAQEGFELFGKNYLSLWD